MSLGSDDAVAAHELDLVTSASKGDGAAFDRFYERHGGSVQLLAERLLGPGPAADAVVVEAFEKTVRRLPLLGARNSSPGLYVLTTARNGAYAALGRERPAASGGPLAALLALPSRQRELLALREIGLTDVQAAEVAGITASDVGPQVARARLRLVDALEGTTLTAAVGDAGDEALLGAVAMRAPGSDDADLDRRLSDRASGDERFAEAVTAVRSAARSVGQLPPASGAQRLAAAAGATAVTAVAGAAGAAAAPPAPQPPATPVPEPTDEGSGADPFDDMIGDEASWGIIDEEPGAAGAGAPAAGAPDLSKLPGSAASAPQPPAGDEEHGWDDLDWPDDEDATVVAPAAAAAAAAAVVPDETDAPDFEPLPAIAADGDAADGLAALEPTRAFDVVGAGLADPEDVLGDEAPRRKSKWRFLGWLIALVLVFAGVAFAVYTVATAARDDSSATTPIEQPEGADSTSTADDEDDEAQATSTRRSGSSSNNSSGGSGSGSGSGSNSSNSSSSSSNSGGSGGSGGSNSSSSGSNGASNGSSSSSSGSGGNSTGNDAESDRTVSGEGSESGGAVRGESGTSP